MPCQFCDNNHRHSTATATTTTTATTILPGTFDVHMSAHIHQYLKHPKAELFEASSNPRVG